MTRALSLALAALVAAASFAVAEECVMTTSETGFLTQVVFVPGLDLYFVHDVCQIDGTCLFSTWFYWETNGVPGLQRHDEMHDDTCGGEYVSDTIVS